MGTNYYLREQEKEPCPCCNRPYEVVQKHIGKSSFGWCFSLHVDPANGINDLDDWKKLWSQPGCRIVDEYDRDIRIEDMIEVITERIVAISLSEKPWGYSSWEEFHSRNYSESGPNNLLRCSIDRNRYCIGHGIGTWDLIVGEFS